MTDHLRTGGNARLNRLQHQLHVQTGVLGDRKPLRDAGDLDSAHQIVDQLVDRAGADRAEMPDRGRERRKIRPRAFEVGRLGANQQSQFSAGRGIRQTRDRTIDIDQAAPAKLAREIERVTVRDRGTLDGQCTGFGGCDRAILAEPHRARCFIVGNHRHNRIGALGRVRRGLRPPRAARDQIFGL